MYNVSLGFTWDNEKAARNRRKHGVSFDEAESVFYDPFGIQYFDEAHSSRETRYLILGRTRQNRLLMVSHTELEDGGKVRIISARRATKSETVFYRTNLS